MDLDLSKDTQFQRKPDYNKWNLHKYITNIITKTIESKDRNGFKPIFRLLLNNKHVLLNVALLFNFSKTLEFSFNF